MDFGLSSDQELMLATLREVCKPYGLDYWRDKDRNHEFITEFWDVLGAGGWLGISIAEEYGGGGQGALDVALVVEEAARSGAGATVAQFFMFAMLQATTLSRHGTDEQKERFLPAIASGRLDCAIALTEPDAGSNSFAITTTARRKGDDYVLNGQKVWISGLERAGRMLVVARTSGVAEGAPPSSGMSLFLVDTASPGIERSLIEKLGTNCMTSSSVYLTDVVVPAEDRIGAEGAGWRILVDTLNIERIVTTSGAVGAGKLALELAARYANERVVFGRPIAANQGVQYPLASARATLECATALNHKAAWLFDQGRASAAEGNMAKMVATDAAFAACDAAMQVHGGYGYSREYHIERLWRDARLFRIAPVTQEMALNFVAHHVLGMSRLSMDDLDSWLEGGAFPVADGVHRIPLPLPNDGLRAVNVYAIADSDGLTLIDSGWALTESRDRLEASLGQLGHDLASVRRFLITHVHRDHYSQAAVLGKLFGSRVSLGAGERDSLSEIRPSLDSYPRHMLARFARAGIETVDDELLRPEGGQLRLDQGEWSEPDDWLHDGDVIDLGTRRLVVIATPGHTAGHVVFHDPAGQLLFAGDHVLPTITPSIGFEPAPTRRSLLDYLDSLAKVAALADSTLLPAHGPVRPSTTARIGELREHHRARLEQTLAAVAAGASTASDAARRLRWTRRDRALDELSPFNQMLAVNETLAHLELLHSRGAVQLSLVGAVAHYTPA
jgi:acyl-CoA dehydrogenase